MSLSPLAERIYQTLTRQLRLPKPLISYGDLVRALGPLAPPNTNLKPNDLRLFEALGEICRACQSNNPPLPTLSSIVVRRAEDGSLGAPGPGYFALVFPQARNETTRMQMWRDEVRRVVACPYPAELTSKPFRRPRVPRPVPRWLSHPRGNRRHHRFGGDATHRSMKRDRCLASQPRHSYVLVVTETEHRHND